MDEHEESRSLGDLSAVLVIVAAIVLAGPLRTLWVSDQSHWLAPYGLWALLVAAGAGLAWKGGRRR